MVIKERSPKLLAVRQATSQKTREVAHPHLFRVNVQIELALYFPVDVAHPPADWMDSHPLVIFPVAALATVEGDEGPIEADANKLNHIFRGS